MTAEATQDAPTGSRTGFRPAPFLIVSGAFVCDPEYMIDHHVGVDVEVLDAELCQDSQRLRA